VRFWDASAVVPLLVKQAFSAAMERSLAEDPEVIVWWGTSVECYSALSRLARDGQLDRHEQTAAERRLAEFRQTWDEVMPTDAVRRSAERLLRLHPLRSGDALQLAAALAAAGHEPERMEILCLDTRLSEAARREGFAVIQN
jgi:predicted nucleic acid-binding protein